jgi:hypothetical protein
MTDATTTGCIAVLTNFKILGSRSSPSSPTAGTNANAAASELAIVLAGVAAAAALLQLPQVCRGCGLARVGIDANPTHGIAANTALTPKPTSSGKMLYAASSRAHAAD